MSLITSRTMVLLGLLVASSLCVTANAGRDLAGTSKLGVDLSGTVNSVTSKVMNLFANGGRTVDIVFTISTVGESSPIVMAVNNGMGGTVQMDIEPGVVNKLAPIAVAVKKDRLVAITMMRNGKTKTISMDLAKVAMAVNRAASPEVTTEVDLSGPLLGPLIDEAAVAIAILYETLGY